MSSILGLSFLVIGYLIIATFIVIERRLRQTPDAKKFETGEFDSGSTLLIGAAFGIGLMLPVVMLVVGIGGFSTNVGVGLLGLALMLGGFALRVWAATTLGKYYTRTLLTSENQKVVMTGPYARIRHPGYLGDLLLWSGFGLLSSNLIVAIVFPVMFVTIYLYRIGKEETMLAKGLGSDYVQYQRRTRKLIPFVY